MDRLFFYALRCLIVLALLPGVLLAGQINPKDTVTQGISTAPPHPALLEQLQKEGRSLPMVSARLGQGIDQPRAVTAPPSGIFNLLVVAVDFPDNTWLVQPTFFDTMIFAPPGSGSVVHYFHEVSYGSLTLVTLDLPGSLWWKQAPLPYNGPIGYVNPDGLSGTPDDYGFGPYPQNLQGLVEDILWIIDPLVNFSNYDNDGDGFVDGVAFIHAGPGAEITINPNDIWSSAWDLTNAGGPGPYQTQDGVWVDNFAFDPEYMYAPGDQTIGVYCHELGHTLFGLPDLYDTFSNNTPPYSNGVGLWSLMSYGMWNGPSYNGKFPAWPDAWSRTVMGFDDALPIFGNMPQWPFQPTYVGPHISIVKLRSPQMGSKEYFLLENRQQVGFDAYLPASGLLIWHVDEDKWNLLEGNDYECLQSPCCSGQCPTTHALVALEQADGLLDLENAVNFGDAGDPYPGSTVNVNFGFGTTPESGSYYASTCPTNSCIAVTNFNPAMPPPVIQADVNVVCSTPGGCLDIQLSEPFGWGQAGSQVAYQAMVQNCGNALDPTVTLTAQSDWLFTFFDPYNGQPIPYPPQASISAGGFWNTGISVTVPAEALWGAADTLALTATSSFPGVSVSEMLTSSVPHCVLVVDDDRSLPDVESTYLDALQEHNINFDYWDATVWGSPDLTTLAAHLNVVWFTGIPPRTPPNTPPYYDTLEPREEITLASYLRQGGGLLLSSQDYLSDVGRSAFNRVYLRMRSYLDDTSTSIVTGVAGNPVGDGLGPYTLTSPALYSDQVTSIPAATGAFVDSVGLTNTLTYDSGVWQTLFLAWPFENLASPDALELMAAAADWFNIPPRPTVDFSIDPPVTCVGEQVSFENLSQDATAYLWDFGDGLTSTLTDTTHIYTEAMTATVTLTASNCCDLAASQQALSVYNVPQAGFDSSVQAVLVGESVIFTSTSLYAESYLWDFGDGFTSTLPDPVHIYDAPLTAVVSLTVTNPCQTSVYTDVIAVYGQVVAGFEVDIIQAQVGQVVHFTNTSLYADDYSWDFGDGLGSSTLVNPTYVYTIPGTYTVTLTAVNPLSADTYQQQIEVIQQPDSYQTFLPCVLRNSNQGTRDMRQEMYPKGGAAIVLMTLTVVGWARLRKPGR